MLAHYRYERMMWLQRAMNRNGDGGDAFRRANNFAIKGFYQMKWNVADQAVSAR